MPTDRVLIEIVTAANMAGVTEAQAGLLGFNPVALATGLALGGLVVAGKDAIAVSQEHTLAEGNLANAIKNRGGNAQAVNFEMAAFMQTNRDFISNQNDVINSYASLIRVGTPAKDLTKDMGTALNMSVAENISLTDAVGMLQSAEAGRTVGLKKLVGITLEAIPAHATLAEKEAIIAYNLGLVAAAYDGATTSLDPLTRATNTLKTDWEKIAETYGPELVAQVSALAKEIDRDMPTWITWLGKLNDVGNQLSVLPGLSNAAGLSLRSLFGGGVGGPPTQTNYLPASRGGGSTLGSSDAGYQGSGQGGSSYPQNIGVTINAVDTNNAQAVAAAVSRALRAGFSV